MKEKIKKNDGMFKTLLYLIVPLAIGFFLFSTLTKPEICVSECFPKTQTYVAFIISALLIIYISFLEGKEEGKEEEAKYYRGEK